MVAFRFTWHFVLPKTKCVGLYSSFVSYSCMLNRQRQNHSLHWKMKLPNFRFFFRSKLIQPWIRLQRWQICLHQRLSLYIKSNRLRWVFIQLLCNYELFKADLSRRCSSYDILKTCMKVFSYRSSCVLHSEKRQ